jgi:hypothetical protein
MICKSAMSLDLKKKFKTIIRERGRERLNYALELNTAPENAEFSLLEDLFIKKDAD